MKEVPKKEQPNISGGLVNVPVVPAPTWPTPIFPTEPCAPVIDPLGDGEKYQPK